MTSMTEASVKDRRACPQGHTQEQEIITGDLHMFA